MMGGEPKCIAIGSVVCSRIRVFPATSPCGMGVSTIATFWYFSSSRRNSTAVAAFASEELKSRSISTLLGTTSEIASICSKTSRHGRPFSLSEV
jgi:hypothetical protein